MTDADLKALVELRDEEIKTLRRHINFWKDEAERLRRLGDLKSRRIQTLMEDLNEFRRKEAQPQ
jgi:endonuclease III-like uncharacterized protein